MNWHQKIFPTVTIIIIALVIVFITVSLQQFTTISNNLNSMLAVNAQPIIDKAMGTNKETLNESLETGSYIAQWAGLFMLETAAMERRHHQANALLASRLWIRYLAVMAGIILIAVGSIFILAKLNEVPTEIEGESQAVKLKLTSASPGLVMAMLGAMLIMTAVLHNPSIELKDGKAYMGNENEALPGVAQ
ncbi:hypothetical protein [Nitrosomonas ureae]|uniref:Uncharacterized protein n=1 Tax=Nitrosomonas ureae TaxID=44577 RepID=A0A1H9AAJ0_9PROT|nr:hypothetical protein [Nitrosomonas ureae]PXX13691.1 hypothetical protein C8R27_12063 [Nitrosomonas ureae]SEP73680.1 hypothetical protein SAMN05421510_100332 [Nitrosomonas ureae]